MSIPLLRALAVMLALALLLAACTGAQVDDPASSDGSATEAGDDPTDDDDTAGGQAAEDEDEDEAADGETAPAGPAPIAAGATAPDVDPATLDAALAWIRDESGLSEMLQEELFLQSATTTLDVTHLTFVQEHGQVAVQGAVFIVHVRDDGEVLGASQSLTTTLPGEDTDALLDEDDAVATVTKQIEGEVDGTPVVRSTWLEVGDELRLGWQVQLATTSPTSTWEAVVDATTGEVLTLRETLIHQQTTNRKAADQQAEGQTSRDDLVAQTGPACAAPAPPSACIYVVSPHFASGRTDVPPEDADRLLTGVPLTNLADPSDGQLVGTHARIWQPVAAEYLDPDNVFGDGGRAGDATFEAAMTYYWIDYTQQVVQSLGFRYHADDPVEFVPIDPEFRDNAAYLPFVDRIHMGDSSFGPNFAEDGDVVVHEYGHALLEAAVPDIRSEEGGAFHEGFADLVAALTTLEFRRGDSACLGSWTAGGGCIRRLDTDLVHPTDLEFEVHLDAQIYTGAVWDLLEARLAQDGLAPGDCQQRPTPCDTARDEVLATLLGSLPFLTPTLSLQDAADAMAASDATFFEGRNAALVVEAFTAHGLPPGTGGQVVVDGTAPGGAMPSMGEVVTQTGRTHLAVAIAHTYRGDLSVEATVTSPEGRLLCQPIVIREADEADDEDNVTGRLELSDHPCAAHAPPSAERIWTLTVVDGAPQDTGEVRAFTVIHDGVQHRATGLPVTIADDDPLGVTVQIADANAPAAGPEDQPPADAPPADTPPADAPSAGGGAVTGSLDITHTYVGDLSIALGVIDAGADEVLCLVRIRDADGGDASQDLSVAVDATPCAPHWPPGQGRTWVLRVLDNAAADAGTIQAFHLTGPDGTTRSLDAPVPIPDDDESGALVVFDR